MDKKLFNKFNEFFYMYLNMDKYNVIAHCADGDVIIGKDGINNVTLDEAAEIVDAHKNMGVEFSIVKVVKL